jgi:hypothetical protein
MDQQGDLLAQDPVSTREPSERSFQLSAVDQVVSPPKQAKGEIIGGSMSFNDGSQENEKINSDFQCFQGNREEMNRIPAYRR